MYIFFSGFLFILVFAFKENYNNPYQYGGCAMDRKMNKNPNKNVERWLDPPHEFGSHKAKMPGVKANYAHRSNY